MYLHYLVKREILIAHMLPSSCYKKTEFIPPQLWPPYSIDLKPVDFMWELLQEKVHKTRITALGLSTMPLTNGFRSDDIAQL